MNFQGLEFDGVPTDQDVESDDNESVSSLVDEDVDFNHVYALFEFPAMVEGQVSVQDGEKLTLLDDSNSYWWLVQVVRNNQIGYIPAENVETAREKLARVNRRKNLKLCMADPEHIVSSRIRPVPNTKSRRVQFNSKLVTQVFISNPVTDDEDDDDDDDDDEDEDDDDGYGYDEDEEEEGAVEHVHIGGSGSSSAHSLQADGVKSDADFSDDNSDYSYYYSADAGNISQFEDNREAPGSHRQANAANLGSVSGPRRANTPAPTPGQISGESMVDSDAELDDNHMAIDADNGDHGDGQVPRAAMSLDDEYDNSHEKAHIPHIVTGPSDFYPSNDDSDEGDSIMGALDSANAEQESEEAGRYSLKIVHVDAFSTSEATITAFADEMFSEVLHRALAVFNIAQSLKFEFRLHAQIQQRGIVPLNYDGQVSSFLDYLHKTTRIRVPDAGAIDPDVCTIALADKSMPQSRLLPASSPAEDDPYMNLETGSRSILRTSIAASVGEGIQAAPSASNADAAATGPADNMQRDPPAHDTERKAQIEPVDVGAASSASGSSQTANKDGSSDAAKTRPTISSPSFGPNEKEQLPDSRQVVQGLLRSIPPPKTRPPQSAINRAKRNTVQISALGTIVGADFQASASPPEQHPSLLTRSSSTLGYISKPTSSTLSPDSLKPLNAKATASATDIGVTSGRASVAASSPSPTQAGFHLPGVSPPAGSLPGTRSAGASADTTAASQAAAAVNSTNQVLVQSTSTLRPSSETAASEEAGEPDDADDQQESSETVDVNDGDDDSEPLSPTTSSDTASLQRSVSNSARILDDGSTAVTSSIGRSGSQRDAPSHQLLKDDAASRDMALARSGITAISGVLPTSDPSSMAIQTPGEEELPLDDWLLILRGWKEMHDISTSASSFYQSFLKEIQASPTGPNTDGAVQRERYAYIQRQVAELQTTSKDTQAAIDDILNVSQGVGRRLDTLERELDDIARVLVHAS